VVARYRYEGYEITWLAMRKHLPENRSAGGRQTRVAALSVKSREWAIGRLSAARARQLCRFGRIAEYPIRLVLSTGMGCCQAAQASPVPHSATGRALPCGRSPGAAVEREFGRLKNEYGLAPLWVRGLEQVVLHADLVMLARLASALSRARAELLAA
jgi:hypothetical protein